MSEDKKSPKRSKPTPKDIKPQVVKKIVEEVNSDVKDDFIKTTIDATKFGKEINHNAFISAAQAAANIAKNMNNPVRVALDKIETLGWPQNYYNTAFDSDAYISNFENISSLKNWSPHLNPKITSEMTLETEIAKLKVKLSETVKEFEEKSENDEQRIKKLNEIQEELKAKEKISHVITRVNEVARKRLLQSNMFLEEFNNSRNCEAVVVSIDIRRSTELMLKARTPELFSKFITELSSKLSTIIIENYGIFDKFTGDGILAFFPKFYSGDQAILRALKASEECHQIFDGHYNAHKKSFSVFITNIGLGIGIDYGNVTLVNTTNELTVVGIPVVYACRMSSAKAGDTILNIPAYEELENTYQNQQLNFEEVIIDIKNEGLAQAYKVESKNNKGIFNSITEPKWLEDEIEEILKETK